MPYGLLVTEGREAPDEAREGVGRGLGVDGQRGSVCVDGERVDRRTEAEQAQGGARRGREAPLLEQGLHGRARLGGLCNGWRPTRT